MTHPPIIPESIAVGAISTIVGFVMTDAMWALLVAQVGTIAIMVVKDRRDLRNRVEDRLVRESEARIAREAIAKVAELGGEREQRIIAKMETVKEEVAKQAAPGSSAANPLHMVSENTDANPMSVKPVDP